MNKDLPLFSIVTPSYNQGRFIEDTILSVKNQDYPNIEHIVVDGGSTDNTLEILKKYENEYNLRWISEPDEGQSDAVNKGFRMTKGEIIGWLNSDDVYFDKQAISCVVEEFKKFSDVDVIYGDAVIINENGLILRVIKNSRWVWNYKLLLLGYPPTQPSIFFRKKVILNNKIDETLDYTMDTEFWLRLFQNGYNFHYLNKILSGDRFHKMKKSIYHIDLHTIEKIKVLEKYGQKMDFYIYGLYFVNRINLAILRRILGCKDVLKIDENNLAFNGTLPRKFRRIRNQLCLSKIVGGIISLVKGYL